MKSVTQVTNSTNRTNIDNLRSLAFNHKYIIYTKEKHNNNNTITNERQKSRGMKEDLYDRKKREGTIIRYCRQE